MSDDIRKGQDVSGIQDKKDNETDRKTDLSRRKFAKAGLIAAPVVMTLASRPALAQKNFCTISGWGSVNPSGLVGERLCKGRSPGFWKTYGSGPTAAAWALADTAYGIKAGPANPVAPGNEYSVPTEAELNFEVDEKRLTQDDKDEYVRMLRDETSTFDDLIGFHVPGLPDLIDGPSDGVWTLTRPTIMHVLWDMPGSDAFHYAASLLNAAAWDYEYGYTLEEMRNLIATLDGTPGFIADLESLYERPGS